MNTQRPFIGISRGNFSVFIGVILVGWFSGLSIATTLLICGTLGFVAMIVEPPLFAWMERRRQSRIVHYVIVPDANRAYQRVPHRVAKPDNSSAAPKPEDKPTEGK